jgi:hypothetical protein
MTTDGAGGFMACWESWSDDPFVLPDMWAQRVDPNGTLLWGPDGTPACLGHNGAFFGKIVGAGDNSAIVAWDDARSGWPQAKVYANLLLGGGASGAPRLDARAPLLALASGNPTRGGARFQLQLPSARSVVMEVHDVAGRRIRSLASGWLGAGAHSLAWDGTDASGRSVGSGVYFVRLTAGNESQTSRVVVIR